MPKYYAGITKRSVEERVDEHRREGKRKNIRNVVWRGYYKNGRDANAWERGMGLAGYDTEPGGISNSYVGTVNCYTFTYGW